MQNLADAMTTTSDAPIQLASEARGGDGLADALSNGEVGAGGLAERLDTFLVYNMRRKVGGWVVLHAWLGSARFVPPHPTPPQPC